MGSYLRSQPLMLATVLSCERCACAVPGGVAGKLCATVLCRIHLCKCVARFETTEILRGRQHLDHADGNRCMHISNLGW